MYRSALHVQPDETDAAPEPIPVVGQGRMPCTIAVVSDGSTLTHRGLAGGAGSVEPVLRHWAATGSEQAGGSERRVVTDRAMTAAAAATAALLTTLRRRGLSPGRSRVVIAGATTMPVLRPLLLAAGFGCVTSWDRRDAVTFPLRWITRNAEAVVDLLGCTQELAEAASDHPELIIITPDETSWTLLALPGLLRAAATAQDPNSTSRARARDRAAHHGCPLRSDRRRGTHSRYRAGEDRRGQRTNPGTAGTRVR